MRKISALAILKGRVKYLKILPKVPKINKNPLEILTIYSNKLLIHKNENQKMKTSHCTA